MRTAVSRTAEAAAEIEEAKMEALNRDEWEALPQCKRRQAPLWPDDRDDRTYGCRASNPDACSKHRMPKVCAFAREDLICLAPPRSWAKLYQKLLAERVE